ncbi:MAG: hypothetical protein CSA29_06350 [Desulfobacterales bacterium]|nr:MAG: hypothetical protein CSA29_06350 [Desulfobacterales bacterium]
MNILCFFPFTDMSPAQAHALAAIANVFGSIKVLTLKPSRLLEHQPFQQSEGGQLEFVSVDQARLACLDAQVQGFKDWAAIHRGNEMNLKALIREKVWLNDENSLLAIQSRIRSQAGPGGSGPGAHDDVPQGDPLLVLRFAEILDMENQAIRQRLNTVDENNAALFATLKGEMEDTPDLEYPTTNVTLENDPFEEIRSSQMEDRIRAWCAAADQAGCFAGVSNAAGGRVVLITTSPAVMAFMATNVQGTINRLDIDFIKVHEQDCVYQKEQHFILDDILETLTLGENNALLDETNMAECDCPVAHVQLCAFSGRELNNAFNIPGGQVIVCLVTLNS